ncbi:MAG: prolyl oligopeptidase family serine peptidase [Acidobacteria bacterium]|nr:prolyl oligopeptidase family serine peptidase [Acidobacteriota bacterium]
MKKVNWLSTTAIFAILAITGVSIQASACLQQPAAPTAPPAASDGSHIVYSSLPSAALGSELKFAVQLPPSYDKDAKRKYPVLYFLHGMFGNEGEFERRGVAAAINRLRDSGIIGEMIIVAPNGKNSFYLNAKNGDKYEDAIIKDLIPFIEKTYRVDGTRDGRAIQGISMGGFGALVLAFKHPQMFSSVTAHCAAVFAELPTASGTDRRSQFRAQLAGNIFGNPPDNDYFHANNPMDVAETNAAMIKKSGLKIYFDVGDQDHYGFTEPNKDFDARLTKAGIAHEFHVFPGRHGWEYMISVADHSYAFLWSNFKINGKVPAKSAGSE